jgi:hypothetical protein
VRGGLGAGAGGAWHSDAVLGSSDRILQPLAPPTPPPTPPPSSVSPSSLSCTTASPVLLFPLLTLLHPRSLSPHRTAIHPRTAVECRAFLDYSLGQLRDIKMVGTKLKYVLIPRRGDQEETLKELRKCASRERESCGGARTQPSMGRAGGMLRQRRAVVVVWGGGEMGSRSGELGAAAWHVSVAFFLLLSSLFPIVVSSPTTRGGGGTVTPTPRVPRAHLPPLLMRCTPGRANGLFPTSERPWWCWC